MNKATLTCPACTASLTPSQVLESCSFSLAGSDLLRLQCPRCGAAGLARLAEGRLEIGEAAGEGGAAFRPTAAAAEPDLFVRRDIGWVDCWLARVYRRFPVGP